MVLATCRYWGSGVRPRSHLGSAAVLDGFLLRGGRRGEPRPACRRDTGTARTTPRCTEVIFSNTRYRNIVQIILNGTQHDVPDVMRYSPTRPLSGVHVGASGPRTVIGLVAFVVTMAVGLLTLVAPLTGGAVVTGAVVARLGPALYARFVPARSSSLMPAHNRYDRTRTAR